MTIHDIVTNFQTGESLLLLRQSCTFSAVMASASASDVKVHRQVDLNCLSDGRGQFLDSVIRSGFQELRVLERRNADIVDAIPKPK